MPSHETVRPPDRNEDMANLASRTFSYSPAQYATSQYLATPTHTEVHPSWCGPPQAVQAGMLLQDLVEVFLWHTPS